MPRGSLALSRQSSTSTLHFPADGAEGRTTVVGEEGAEGCTWFDESFEHNLSYTGGAERAVLLIDVVHPGFYHEGGELLSLDLQPAPPQKLYWQSYFERAQDDNHQRSLRAARRISDRYSSLCRTKGDINEHLPVLRDYASNVSSVVELGVRGTVSTWAFLEGLVHSYAPHKLLIGVDRGDCDYVEATALGYLCGVNTSFIKGDSATVSLPRRDLLFIDTFHVYGHLRRELDAHHGSTTRYIILHDTEIDGEFGEALRNGADILELAAETGYLPEELMLGLRPAINEFLDAHPEWFLALHLTNNYGLTVLERSV